jgi:hypothetical protein
MFFICTCENITIFVLQLTIKYFSHENNNKNNTREENCKNEIRVKQDDCDAATQQEAEQICIGSAIRWMEYQGKEHNITRIIKALDDVKAIRGLMEAFKGQPTEPIQPTDPKQPLQFSIF